MIVYDLICEENHKFEGWFSSQDNFNKQKTSGQIVCPFCGSTEVGKQLSAPYVSAKSSSKENPIATNTNISGEVIETLRQKVVEHIIKNSDDVGKNFPEEARKIFYNEKPARSIRGKATKEDVQELKEEGIEVLGIPAVPIPPDQAH